MGLLKNYKSFSSRGYLRIQYGTFSTEERFILRFLHEAYEDFGLKRSDILELGGGPSIYQLISASRYAKAITVTDFLQKNLDEVESWKNGKQHESIWRSRFEFVARLERVTSARTIKNRLRSKLLTFAVVNVLGPTSQLDGKKFDVVSSHFCAESITNDTETFLKAMRFITSFVKPRGMLVMSFMKQAKSYYAGKRIYAAYPLDETAIRKLLKRLGFSDIKIETVDVEHARESNANMCVRAIRSKRHPSRR